MPDLLALALAWSVSGPGAISGPEGPGGWLSGCWISEDGVSVEAWSSPHGGFLFGHAVEFDGARVSFFEQLRIEPGEGDSLRYAAYPRGQGPVLFDETARSESSITFANPDHDFPQQIEYRRTGDQLTAVISLLDGARKVAFNKEPCQLRSS